MPQLAAWDDLPYAVRQHLVERLRERAIRITDLNQLRLWIEPKPNVPEGDWHKDFVRSRFADADLTPRHSCFADKLREAPPSEWKESKLSQNLFSSAISAGRPFLR
jgi:hypothetical protein